MDLKIKAEIENYFSGIPEPKRKDLEHLHIQILRMFSNPRCWYLDGKNEEGKVVSNPNVGYGSCFLKLAGGKTREFYQVGLSANTAGISIYLMGLNDSNFLVSHALSLGKAKITSYVIRFKKLADLNESVLLEVIREGIRKSSNVG